MSLWEHGWGPERSRDGWVPAFHPPDPRGCRPGSMWPSWSLSCLGFCMKDVREGQSTPPRLPSHPHTGSQSVRGHSALP